jgi:hypothetical protein
MNILKDKILLWILALGFILRVLFLLYGAQIYYGTSIHETGDTGSYIYSFINLLNQGSYTFDPSITEASFGRLPGYPFFFGLHYILFGKANAFLAVSISQLLLDTVVIFLIGSCAFKLTESNLAKYFSSFLYAVYPFSIVWITIIGTETLSIFLICLWFYALLSLDGSAKKFILLGILVAVCFFVREFLGILLPITCGYVFLKFYKSQKFISLTKNLLLVIISFTAIYIWWPARNYISFKKLVLVKPASAGYANLTEDVQAYIKWYHCWSNDDNKCVAAAISEKPVDFPREIFSSTEEKILADSLIGLSRTCGTGFYVRKYNQPYPGASNCNDTIAIGFARLKESYIKNHPFSYYTKVPFENLKKAFFKTGLETEKKGAVNFLITLLFIGRTILLLLGIGYLLASIRKINFLPLLSYFAFIYLFICFYHRSLEMRYIIHADVLLLIPAGIVLSVLYKKINGTVKQKS